MFQHQKNARRYFGPLRKRGKAHKKSDPSLSPNEKGDNGPLEVLLAASGKAPCGGNPDAARDRLQSAEISPDSGGVRYHDMGVLQNEKRTHLTDRKQTQKAKFAFAFSFLFCTLQNARGYCIIFVTIFRKGAFLC